MTMTKTISQDQLIGMLRILVPTLLAYFVSRGWITSEDTGALVNAIINFTVAAVALGSIVWSFMSNRKASQIAKVAAMPEVKKIIADSHIANVVLADERKVVDK